MSKLHELLAVIGSLEKTAINVIREAKETFEHRKPHFSGSVRRYVPFDGDKVDQEATTEHKEMVTTVPKKLKYVFGPVVKWLDGELQRETTNQNAKADITVGGEVLAKDVPATFLLGLEAKLKHIRDLIFSVPTLAPGIAWTKDESQDDDVYVTVHPEESFKTRRVTRPLELSPATEHHPAQVDTYQEEENIGKYTKITWSGMLSPADKSRILGNVDTLIAAVKAARMRANNTDVVKANIGATVAKFIINGSV